MHPRAQAMARPIVHGRTHLPRTPRPRMPRRMPAPKTRPPAIRGLETGRARETPRLETPRRRETPALPTRRRTIPLPRPMGRRARTPLRPTQGTCARPRRRRPEALASGPSPARTVEAYAVVAATRVPRTRGSSSLRTASASRLTAEGLQKMREWTRRMRLTARRIRAGRKPARRVSIALALRVAAALPPRANPSMMRGRATPAGRSVPTVTSWDPGSASAVCRPRARLRRPIA